MAFPSLPLQRLLCLLGLLVVVEIEDIIVTENVAEREDVGVIENVRLIDDVGVMSTLVVVGG